MQMILLAEIGIHLNEIGCVPRTVVGWHAHAEEQNLRAALEPERNHLRQVVLRYGEGDSPQSVVRSELKHQNPWPMKLQRPGKTLQATTRRFAAYAGVHDLVPVTLST